MGSRGSFVDVKSGDFSFVENGKTYQVIGEWEDLKVLAKSSGSIQAPEYSHTANRIYAVIQNGALKHLAYYDKEHKQSISIDLLHKHHGVQPHKHIYLDHSDDGIPITQKESDYIKHIKRRFHLK